MKVLCTHVAGVLALAILLSAAHTTARAEDPAANSAAAPSVYEKKEQGVLVLRDGGVLEGRVEQVGDRYKVIRVGSEVEVVEGKVLFACGSLSEAYDRRRRLITQLTADPHLELSDWCIRWNLFEEAAKEIDEARKLDPGHPRLNATERRLKYARDRKSQSSPPPHPPAPESPVVVPVQVTLPIEDLSGEAVERFTRKVQPILVNNCTTGGCHQMGGAQSFQLDRALLHGLANRRSTMHNLSETLELIDRNQPHLSPLLVTSRSSHGGLQEPLFGPKDETAFRHVMDWVALVTKSADQKESTPADAKPQAADLDSPAYNSVGEAALTADSNNNSSETTFGTRPVVRIGAHISRWQPRDEFDPEIFNRQTKARNKQSATAPPVIPGGTP